MHTVPVGSLDTLLDTLDLLRPAVAAHSRRVAVYARQLGVTVRLPSDDLSTLNQAALVHDAGVLIGAGTEMATDLPGLETWCGLSEDVADVLWYSTRRFDHYPHAPLTARLLAVAHAFDELTAAREYHVALSLESARMAIARHANGRFCPVAVNALVIAVDVSNGAADIDSVVVIPDGAVRGLDEEQIARAERLRVNYRLVTTS